MAAQFQLVSAILNRAMLRADCVGQEDRHTPAMQLELFNESAQNLRVLLCNLGFDYFLKETVSAALRTTAASTGETYSEEDWPKDAARIYGVHVLTSPGHWHPLKPISLSGIRDYQGRGSFTLGLSDGPCAFALKEAPFGVAAVETVGKIILVPLPRQARQFKIYYLQNYADAIASDTFNGHAGFISWLVYDVAIKLGIRDNDSNDTLGSCMAERDRLESRFASEAAHTRIGEAEEPRRADERDYDDDDKWSGW